MSEASVNRRAPSQAPVNLRADFFLLLLSFIIIADRPLGRRRILIPAYKTPGHLCTLIMISDDIANVYSNHSGKKSSCEIHALGPNFIKLE